MMAVGPKEEWTQDGAFPDSDGLPIRCRDDVILAREVAVEGGVRTDVRTVPAGTVGTVFFFGLGPPTKVELELYVPSGGFTFGIEQLSRVRLHKSAADKLADYKGDN